jgi:hypothetical protein
MSESLPPRIETKSAAERLARLDEAIAKFETIRRYPSQNDDLLKALRLERDRVAALSAAKPAP